MRCSQLTVRWCYDSCRAQETYRTPASCLLLLDSKNCHMEEAPLMLLCQAEDLIYPIYQLRTLVMSELKAQSTQLFSTASACPLCLYPSSRYRPAPTMDMLQAHLEELDR
jgi:hypothetical protein